MRGDLHTVHPCAMLFAGPPRPKLALLTAMRQKGLAATKKALSSLHDEGAPQVPDLDLVPDVAPSTLAAEMPMMSPEEGASPRYAEALDHHTWQPRCQYSAGKGFLVYRYLTV